MVSAPFLDVPPLRSAGGTVRLPGSKSISNRALLLAALCEGTTVLHDVLDADDTHVMVEALRLLGGSIEFDRGTARVTGFGARLAVRKARLFLGNAGTAMRPLTAVLALLAARDGGEFELSGVERMHERPIGDLVDALRALGCGIDYLGADGYPPLRVHAGEGLQARPLSVRGSVSSQFLSALLLALPLVPGGAARAVEVEGELISKPYVRITLELLARFGVRVDDDGFRRFTLDAAATYRSPGTLHVEGDASSASYFIALGALAAQDEPLRIEGVGSDSIQGDVAFVDTARAMGAEIASGAGWLEVRRGRWPLDPVELDCNHIPDAAMTSAVMALFARGRTLLKNIASWRVKETDRIAAMAAELRRLGATVEEGADWIAITPPAQWRAAAIRTYDDHRVAMCFALAAFNPLAGAEPPVAVRILDPKVTAKTFPDYFDVLFSVARADAADVPVIAIDGPTASGKGTLAGRVAEALGYHHLDSGALYRATALVALDGGTAHHDQAALAAIAARLALRFDAGRTWLGARDVSDALRQEEVGALASRIAALAPVRAALHGLQLAFRRAPGLVADGRDMGSVVFPGAALKVFLTASAERRAERRHKQLISKGVASNIHALRLALEARDVRDQSRALSPLVPAADAVLLDNSALSIEASADQVLAWWQQRRRFD